MALGPRASLGFALVAAAIVASSAWAARAPTRTERANIARAIRASIKNGGGQPVARIKVRGLQVSTVNPRWAAAGVEAWGKNGIASQPAIYVFLRAPGAGTWNVRNYGTDRVGCVMPRAVQDDLKVPC